MQNEPDTAVSRALEQQWYKQLFGVRRSVRYHSYRRQFYLGAQALTSFLIIVLGSGSAMVLFSELDAEWFKILAPMAVTVLAALSLVYGLTERLQAQHRLLKDILRFDNLPVTQRRAVLGASQA